MRKFSVKIKDILNLVDHAELSIWEWDPEWTEFAAFPPMKDGKAKYTPANIRGHITRTLRAKGYGVEFLEPEQPTVAGNLGDGVTFRCWKIPVAKLPPQKRTPIRQFVPPAEEALQLELI